MSYIKFFSEELPFNDVQLRSSNNRLINKGSAKLNISNENDITINASDTPISDSEGSFSLGLNTGVGFDLIRPLKLNESFTFCAWVKVYSLTVARTIAGVSGPGFSYGLYLMDDGNSNRPAVTNRSSWSRVLKYTNSYPQLNTWHHIAFVQNVNKLNIYLDGVKSSNTYTGYLFENMNSIGYAGEDWGGIVGLVDDYYFTRKVLWTDNFTPPTTYLPDNP